MLVEITDWDRKHANKVLLGRRRGKGRRGKRGAPTRYGNDLSEALKTCWLAMEQPCGKRMKDVLSLWARQLECPEEIRIQLCRISAASIDRLLRGFKVTAGKKIRPPKPASAVKALVEIRTATTAGSPSTSTYTTDSRNTGSNRPATRAEIRWLEDRLRMRREKLYKGEEREALVANPSRVLRPQAAI